MFCERHQLPLEIIPRGFIAAKNYSFWWDWRLARRIQSVASVYDYMFSSNIDVILKGYYPVAAYLWICIMGL